MPSFNLYKGPSSDFSHMGSGLRHVDLGDGNTIQSIAKLTLYYFFIYYVLSVLFLLQHNDFP